MAHYAERRAGDDDAHRTGINENWWLGLSSVYTLLARKPPYVICAVGLR
jgi:hypothetical protein